MKLKAILLCMIRAHGLPY